MNDNPAYRQNWILDNLKSNPTESYNDMFTKYSQDFPNISRRTFTKDWEKANSAFKSYHVLINNAKLEESIAQEKEAVKRNILTKVERQQLLSDIARGTVKTWRDGISKFGTERLEFYDPVKYIAELNKMDGSYAQIDDSDEAVITQIKIVRSNGT